MFRTILAAALAAPLLISDAGGSAVRVIDGDTIAIGREHIRILNIDTPEIREAKCESERQRGLAAKRRLEMLLDGGAIGLKRGDGKRMRDRHGRMLALVFVDGRDVGEMLIAEGLARRWTGRRQPWC